VDISSRSHNDYFRGFGTHFICNLGKTYRPSNVPEISFHRQGDSPKVSSLIKEIFYINALHIRHLRTKLPRLECTMAPPMSNLIRTRPSKNQSHHLRYRLLHHHRHNRHKLAAFQASGRSTRTYDTVLCDHDCVHRFNGIN
jgi:hypothetical protein